MTAVMIGEENKRVFRKANAALADRVWAKLLRADAVRPVADHPNPPKEGG